MECRSYAINSDARIYTDIRIGRSEGLGRKRLVVRNVPYVPTEPVEYQTVDSEAIKSEVPDGAENSSVTNCDEIGRTRESGSTESAIDEGSGA